MLQTCVEVILTAVLHFVMFYDHTIALFFLGRLRRVDLIILFTTVKCQTRLEMEKAEWQ